LPRLSVWFVRAALLHLAAGFTLGALLLINKGTPLHPALWQLLPAHIELLLVGWTLNLALGVAYWILPRYKAGPSRGAEWPVWTIFFLLNLGLLAVCAAPWLAPGSGLDAAASFLGRLSEALAAAGFAGHALPRIKPHGT
jgi:hypothetical protein